jgi:uncharacterized peroxidase-related enzyme
LVAQLKIDYRHARLNERQSALCEFADKLTRRPGRIRQEEVERLRAAGLSDRDVLDAVEVIGYFNYINRIADGLGVDAEEWMRR